MKKTFFSAARIALLLALCLLLGLPAAGAESGSVALTEQELAYRDRAGDIVIGCPVNTCPMLFQDEKTGQLEGITIDILDMIAEATGLSFRYQALPSGSISYDILKQLRVDMVAGVENNALNHQAGGLVLTDTYLHAAKVFVCKKGTAFQPDSAMTIAMSTGSQTLERVIRQQYPQFEILFCGSTEEALLALMRGKADAVLQNQYTIERLLRKPLYEGLQIVATASIGDSHCLASIVPLGTSGADSLSGDAALLLSIINKGIAQLDQSQVAFSIIRQTSENAYQYTLSDMMYHYRFPMVGLLLSLLLIVILLHKNRVLHKKRSEQIAAQQRAKELAAINAQMEEQQLLLMDALKHAEEGNRAKTFFLFNMSHDIRTPMNAILGFTELARRNIHDTAKLMDCLEKMQASGKQLLQLINNVLDMTKIESGEVTLAEDVCNLKACIEKAGDPFQTEIAQQHLAIQTDVSTVQNEWVFCDSLRFNQILFNLLSNAVKFSKPGGSIHVTLRQNPCAIQEYAAYELRVKDSGIGMSPAFLTRVFEPFEREYTSTISKTQGTGLGMPITKKLVDLMGGTIEVTSEAGSGTEFILQFTFKLQKQVQQPPEEAAPSTGFAGKRLLLVDDNELNMEIAEELLAETGFLVETAENGQIAVDKVRASAPGYYDAVLMDIQMPVMDGYQASREIRALPDRDLASVPIIALTANAFDEDKKEALANGMNAHIAKPLDIDVLCETLESVLKGR